MSNPAQLAKVKEDTGRLEEEGQKLLNINDKLRHDVKIETEKAARRTPTGWYSIVNKSCDF